jgi:HPt (histidine-containing phosphotransfer) domain-containing protein
MEPNDVLDTMPVVDEQVIAPLHDPALGGDADAAVRAAHSLKGSSSNFGAARVQALCVEIERHGQEGQPQAATPLLGPLEAEYARLVERLDAIIASVAATG